MTEEQISTVWQQLLDAEIDILVCTTLIETGVDVRNCNTLIIENADRMGLSQLYQIRGRVGRSSRRAYAYFTFQRDKVLTEIASKRLSAIREFTAFGSGFRIAMRICRSAARATCWATASTATWRPWVTTCMSRCWARPSRWPRAKQPAPDKSDCLVDINADAYLPEKYIPDAAGRIEAYKRIAAIETADDATDVLDELIDRYGDPPRSVQGLVDISLVRVNRRPRRHQRDRPEGRRAAFVHRRHRPQPAQTPGGGHAPPGAVQRAGPARHLAACGKGRGPAYHPAGRRGAFAGGAAFRQGITPARPQNLHNRGRPFA